MSDSYSVTRRINGVSGIAEMVHGSVAGSSGGHPPHWHSTWQLVTVTGGSGWVKVNSKKHLTPAGSLFFIPPEVVHSNDVFETGCHFRSMLIDASEVEEIAAALDQRLQRNRISSLPVVISRSWSRHFDQFHTALRSSDGPDLFLEDQFQSLIGKIHGRLTDRDPAVSMDRVSISHPAAKKAREYLADHAAEKVSLETLATEAGMSRYELSRQFKAAWGMPPHAWQLQVRVERSKDMLRSGSSPGEVALDLGFSDQAHFTRVFKKATGYSPGRFTAAA